MAAKRRAMLSFNKETAPDFQSLAYIWQIKDTKPAASTCVERLEHYSKFDS